MGAVNGGIANSVAPRILSETEINGVTSHLESLGIKTEFEMNQNAFIPFENNPQVQLASPAGVFYEEAQHALDFAANPEGFIQDLDAIPSAQSPENMVYHADVFDRIASNQRFSLTEEERMGFQKAAEQLRSGR